MKDWLKWWLGVYELETMQIEHLSVIVRLEARIVQLEDYIREMERDEDYEAQLSAAVDSCMRGIVDCSNAIAVLENQHTPFKES